ncbi:unnamed protein product, partial [Albugo candida]
QFCDLQLSETVDDMNSYIQNSSSKVQEALLQRYREIYFDLKSDFRRSTCSRGEDQILLLETIQMLKDYYMNDQRWNLPDHLRARFFSNFLQNLSPNTMQRLTCFRQAMAAKNALENQRSRMTTSRNKMTTTTDSFAGIHNLVASIRRKKMRNNTILALVIATCICFTLWWAVLYSI